MPALSKTITKNQLEPVLRVTLCVLEKKKKQPYLLKLVNKQSVSSKSCSSAAESELLNVSKQSLQKLSFYFCQKCN